MFNTATTRGDGTRIATAGLWRLAVVAVTGLLAVALMMSMTVIPFGRAIWDFLFVLDGAYRISLGQTPHVDFASPVGSLTLYLASAAGVINPDGNQFVGMHALFWLLLLPPLAVLAPRFQSGLGFLAAVGLTALIVLVPFTLESTHLSEISYFATYNRFASGFLLLIGLWYVLPRQRLDWFVPAYILTLLFFLKISAAVVVVGILIAGLILRRCSIWNVVTILAAFLISLVVVEAVTGLVSAYLLDIRQMSAVNQGGLIYALFFAAFRYWLPLTLAGLIGGAALLAIVRQTGFKRVAAVKLAITAEAFVLDALLLVSAALLAESQNTGGYGLISAAAIFFHPAAWQKRQVLTSLLAAALVFPVVDIAVKRPLTALKRERQAAPIQAMAELVPGTRVPLSTYEGARLFTRIATEWLRMAREVGEAGFFLTPDPTTNAPAVQLSWASSVVEAADIFEQRDYRSLADRYATLSFVDPFTRHLNLTSATGTNLVMHVGRTIPEFSPEGARAYLANADGVFVERCDMTDGNYDVPFRQTLNADFHRLPLTDCWDFYARNGAN